MKHTRGFIAITSVLVLSAVFLSISISIASSAISGSDTSIALYERDKAKYAVLGCVEYALMELSQKLYYEGDEGILIGDDSCTILPITGEGNANRIIRTQSTVGSHTYRIETEVEEISPIMLISSFRRVENF